MKWRMVNILDFLEFHCPCCGHNYCERDIDEQVLTLRCVKCQEPVTDLHKCIVNKEKS